MTAMRAPAGAPVSAVPAGHGGELVGLWALIRLNNRRERIPLLIWILGLSAVAASTFSAIASLYPQEAERAALAASITTNPAFLAMLGPVGSTSIGGLSAWRIGVLASTMIGLMAIFTVVRRGLIEANSRLQRRIFEVGISIRVPQRAAPGRCW